MLQETHFPFRLKQAFFKTLEFHREPEMPEQLNVNFSVQVKTHDEGLPDRLEIHLKIETPEGQPLTFCVELIGIFGPIEDMPEPSHDILAEFVNERALHMLWPYLYQITHQVTGQMLANPLKIPTPHMFDLAISQE